ncbi:hypothetical protein [Microlunatus aurantiacus]|uniref:hypothetical protein n=1 Tax=Microlunatus aurantiacus TaxID=446786 RepID=UPI003CD08DF0
MNELVEAADDKTPARTIARYGRVDQLLIDESLATWNSTAAAPSSSSKVLTEREETNSAAIASNDSFPGWTKTFTDPRPCAAIVTGSPSAATSSRLAPTPTASPTPDNSSSRPRARANTLSGHRRRGDSS